MNNPVNGFEKAKGDAMSPFFGAIFYRKSKKYIDIKK